MNDWLVTHLNERERIMYRIAMRSAKDPLEVDDIFHTTFVKMCPERLKRSDAEMRCDSTDLMGDHEKSQK